MPNKNILNNLNSLVIGLSTHIDYLEKKLLKGDFGGKLKMPQVLYEKMKKTTEADIRTIRQELEKIKVLIKKVQENEERLTDDTFLEKEGLLEYDYDLSLI